MERTPLILVMAAVVLVSVATGLARPAIAFYTRYSLESTMLATASLTSSFMLGRMLTSIVSGVASELAPGRQWLLASIPAALAGLVVYIIPNTGSPGLVIGLMAVWGLLGGLTWPTVQIAVAEMAGGRSGTVLSVYFALGTIGVSAGNWLFGHLDLGYGEVVKLGALLMVPPALLIGVALAMHPPSVRARSARSLAGRLRSRIVAWVLLVTLALGLLNGLLREYFYIYSHEVYGLSREALGSLLGVAGVAAFLAGLASGALADRVGIPPALAVVTLIAAAGSVLLGLPHGSTLLLGLGFVLASVGVRASMPLTRNRNLLPGAGGAAVVGLSNAALNLGVLVSPLVAGFLYEHGLGSGGAPYLVLGVVLPLVVASLYPRRV
ncbi:MAG: MFS transporter [Desulfurococcales archaeon]|nr:MFS transporter [Desulfurococcales archaeon]